MESSLVLGLGVSVVSGFARWRFPAIPKALATAGLVIGIGLVIWSQFNHVRPLIALPLILAAALSAAVIDHALLRAVAKTSNNKHPTVINVDQRITSHGQSGGITARDIKVSHDER